MNEWPNYLNMPQTTNFSLEAKVQNVWNTVNSTKIVNSEIKI